MPGDTSNRSEKIGRSEAIKRLFENLPVGYEQRATELHSIAFEFKRQLAEAIAPALNTALKAMPKHTFEQRQHVCEWIRREVDAFDLILRCPRTGRPATIVAGTKDGIGEHSRFRIVIRTDDGKKAFTMTRQELPVLGLMVPPIDQKGFVQRLTDRSQSYNPPQR